MVICLERGAGGTHMVQLMPLHLKPPSSLASFKSRLDLPFWYRLKQAVLEKMPLTGVVVVKPRGGECKTHTVHISEGVLEWAGTPLKVSPAVAGLDRPSTNT